MALVVEICRYERQRPIYHSCWWPDAIRNQGISSHQVLPLSSQEYILISAPESLTHWGRVIHICVGNLTIIGSNKGLLPGRHQAIIGTNAGILLIGPLRTNFSEILTQIHTFSFKKIHLNLSSAKWQPLCLWLNVLMGNSYSWIWQNDFYIETGASIIVSNVVTTYKSAVLAVLERSL